MGKEVELLKVQRVPPDGGIIAQTWLAFLTRRIHRSVHILKHAARRIFNNFWPSLIRFTKGDCICMTGPAIFAERLIGNLADMRSSHYDAYSSSADRISDAIRLFRHSRHGPNTNQSNILVTHKLHDLCIGHTAGVAIDQENFMLRRSQAVQKKHPKMRHEAAGNTI